MPVDILYEDNHLLVVEKPVNIPVQQDKSNDKDLLTILKEHIKVRDQKPGNVFLALVHRLDRPVGGAIVFAKTSKAASRLANHLRKRDISREYLAIIHGTPKRKSDTLEHYLLKDRKKNVVKAVSKQNKQAKKAILDYHVIASIDGFSLLAVKLHTGRSHQIRVQLSSIGHPLFGDQKYGQNMNKPGQQIALWAHKLSFPHTTTKELVRTVSNTPKSYPWNLFSHVDV